VPAGLDERCELSERDRAPDGSGEAESPGRLESGRVGLDEVKARRSRAGLGEQYG
jgi:hypothetical protein